MPPGHDICFRTSFMRLLLGIAVHAPAIWATCVPAGICWATRRKVRQASLVPHFFPEFYSSLTEIKFRIKFPTRWRAGRRTADLCYRNVSSAERSLSLLTLLARYNKCSACIFQSTDDRGESCNLRVTFGHFRAWRARCAASRVVLSGCGDSKPPEVEPPSPAPAARNSRWSPRALKRKPARPRHR